MMPGQTRYQLRQAAMLEAAGGAQNEIEALLLHAARVAPFLAEPWMRLGIFYEASDPQKAEQLLLRAAAADHTFKPVWTLANFYLRQNREGPFWKYARRALELTEPRAYAPEPVFDLCWRASSNAPSILANAIPDNTYVRAAYVRYLLSRNRVEPALLAWRTLHSSRQAQDPLPGYELTEQLIAANRPVEALEVWNASHAGAPTDPLIGHSLTNEGLTSEPTGRGFDWRLEPSPGAALQYFSDGREIRAQLDGSESEDIELLVQNVPVVPGARYSFSFEYRTEDVPPGSGLQWVVVDALNNLPQPSNCASLSSSDPTRAACQFRAGPSQQLVRLALRYRRALGTRLLHGSVRFSKLHLEKLN
jgi:hypothetical protein